MYRDGHYLRNVCLTLSPSPSLSVSLYLSLTLALSLELILCTLLNDEDIHSKSLARRHSVPYGALIDYVVIVTVSAIS